MTKISPLLFLLFTLCSFTLIDLNVSFPKTISRTTITENGMTFEKTIIEFNKNTSREDVIETCAFLSKENVELTFEKLTIGKSFLGIMGKTRIKSATGKIQLADGSTQSFKVGGISNFKSLKIQYSIDINTKKTKIEMIEKID